MLIRFFAIFFVFFFGAFCRCWLFFNVTIIIGNGYMVAVDVWPAIDDDARTLWAMWWHAVETCQWVAPMKYYTTFVFIFMLIIHFTTRPVRIVFHVLVGFYWRWLTLLLGCLKLPPPSLSSVWYAFRTIALNKEIMAPFELLFSACFFPFFLFAR